MFMFMFTKRFAHFQIRSITLGILKDTFNAIMYFHLQKAV